MSFWARNHDSIIVSAISLAVGAAISWWINRRPKTLDVVIKENTLILTAPATTAGERLGVTWDGEPLRHPRLIRLRLVNTGRQVVRSSDFDEGEAFWVTVHGAVIKALDVLSRSGGVQCHQLRPTGDDRVGLLPKSLEPREWVDVQLVVDGEHYKGLSVSARCGLSPGSPKLLLEPEVGSRVERGVWAASFGLLVVFVVIGVVLYRSHLLTRPVWIAWWWATVATALVLEVAVLFVVYRFFFRSWQRWRYTSGSEIESGRSDVPHD